MKKKVEDKKVEVEEPVKEEKKSAEQEMKDLLIYLRDNVVHGSQQHVDRIDQVLEKGGK